MFELQLDMYQTVGLAAVVFWLGNLLIKKSAFLSKYYIPAPLVGGLIFAILNTILTSSGAMTISLDSYTTVHIDDRFFHDCWFLR